MAEPSYRYQNVICPRCKGAGRTEIPRHLADGQCFAAATCKMCGGARVMKETTVTTLERVTAINTNPA